MTIEKVRIDSLKVKDDASGSELIPIENTQATTPDIITAGVKALSEENINTLGTLSDEINRVSNIIDAGLGNDITNVEINGFIKTYTTSSGEEIKIQATSSQQTTTPPVAVSGPPPNTGTWQLSFQDDFGTTELDPDKWVMSHHYAQSNGLGGIAPDNIKIIDGKLHLIATDEPINWIGKDFDYTRGEISTFRKFRQKYGYFECRAKWDPNSGIWPAFWLMPDIGARGNPNREWRSFLKFDLSGFTGTINTAVLSLNTTLAPDLDRQSVQAYFVPDNNWDGNIMTWDNQPKHAVLPDGDKFEPGLTAGDHLDLDVTNTAKKGGIVSLALADVYRNARDLGFSSSKDTIEANRPKIVINGGEFEATAIDDTTVNNGNNSAINYGSSVELRLFDQWKRSNEITNGGMEFDIQESLGHWGPDKTSSTMHWDRYGPDHPRAGSGIVDIPPTTDGFHTFGMDWRQGSATFYVDGKQIFQHIDQRVSSIDSYIIFSLQIGGWKDALGDGRIVDAASFPKGYVVDYVKVWKNIGI